MRRRRKLQSGRAHEVHESLSKQRNPMLADILERNIEVVELLRREADRARTPQERVADWMTAASGSMAFLYLHIAWFAIWIAVNLGIVPGLPKFDPFPFGLLTMVVSLEAIILSTFVLISQNRQAAQGEQRESLDLQIDLLAEYEVTRMLRLVDKIAEKMGIEDAYDAEIDQLCMPVAPDVLLREIESQHEAKNLGKNQAKT